MMFLHHVEANDRVVARRSIFMAIGAAQSTAIWAKRDLFLDHLLDYYQQQQVKTTVLFSRYVEPIFRSAA